MQKDDYLEKSEAKIIKLKSELASANDQIKTLVWDFTNISSLIENYKGKIIQLENEVIEKTNHNNFLKLENSIYKAEKEKLLKGLPNHITELSMAKLLPLEKYNGLNETKNKYKKLILNEKYLERNIMQLNDEFTQMIYGNNQNFNEIRITSDIDPKTKFKRDLAKENHYLSTKVRELETLIEEERLKREGYEAEWNRLRSM